MKEESSCVRPLLDLLLIVSSGPFYPRLPEGTFERLAAALAKIRGTRREGSVPGIIGFKFSEEPQTNWLFVVHPRSKRFPGVTTGDACSSRAAAIFSLSPSSLSSRSRRRSSCRAIFFAANRAKTRRRPSNRVVPFADLEIAFQGNTTPFSPVA